jgi:hypothetical protein
MNTIRNWIRALVADDPNPTYSRLDRYDGLGTIEKAATA